MHRELKFRIWDKKNNIFIYLWDASHKRLAISLNGLVYSGEYDDVLTENDYIIQQYTGLKDKNGILIFEGDILEYSNLYYEVMWADYQWIATCPYYNHYHWPKFESFGREARISIVCGNVMQNPELLQSNE